MENWGLGLPPIECAPLQRLVLKLVSITPICPSEPLSFQKNYYENWKNKQLVELPRKIAEELSKKTRGNGFSPLLRLEHMTPAVISRHLNTTGVYLMIRLVLLSELSTPLCTTLISKIQGYHMLAEATAFR